MATATTTPTGGLADTAERNRAVFADPHTVASYAAGPWRNTWLSAGERILVRQLASETRNMPLLDIGVGGGRTTGLLTLISDEYVAIDFSSEMVAATRAAYPQVDVRVGDARDLSAFPDEHFGAVVFSFNGIDSVEHDDRARVLGEIHRVLRPDGLLHYSTLNKGAIERLSKPWRDLRVGGREEWRGLSPTARARRGAVALAVLLRRVPMLADWRRTRAHEEDHGDWAMATLGAHGFRLLNHMITPPAARAEIATAGFTLLEMLDWDGAAVGESSSTSSLFVLARKRA